MGDGFLFSTTEGQGGSRDDVQRKTVAVWKLRDDRRAIIVSQIDVNFKYHRDELSWELWDRTYRFGLEKSKNVQRK